MDALGRSSPIRLGAVEYLNTRPLVYFLSDLAPGVEIRFDLPSRLADRLARGGLEVATIPSIEYFRLPNAVIVSDACVACHGPVRSVMLYGRKPAQKIQTLALDEGSRTSAALTRILLSERYGVLPELRGLPIGKSVSDTNADAVMLIGDRGMVAQPGDFEFVWDLGEEWNRWTGLPFVFSMWVGRPGANLDGLDSLLSAARDDGVNHLEKIARVESTALGISPRDCLTYLRDHLRFHFGPDELRGLTQFGRLAAKHGLIPAEVPLRFHGDWIQTASSKTAKAGNSP